MGAMRVLLVVAFQSTPPIRVATYRVFAPPSPSKFQSTPPIRVATIYRPGIRPVLTYFNPRHPYGWRRYTTHRVSKDSAISIHATHTGGDLQVKGRRCATCDFNPRHPYGWRLASLSFVSLPVEISIHATHTGGDLSLQFQDCTFFQFQSTPPIRVATEDKEV